MTMTRIIALLIVVAGVGYYLYSQGYFSSQGADSDGGTVTETTTEATTESN